ncbi:MAG TPA: cysteine dioxygenase family protein [Methylomirabilota bacterium]|nr:cysteine dioxygenase family protein [Methylomirabilota bacterium]
MMTLSDFIQQVTRIAGSPDAPRQVAPILRAALANPALLDPAHREPGAERYRQHLLHVDAAGRFSVVALVWAAGQATPVHDHVAWCVVGVYEGREREILYTPPFDGADDRVTRASVRECGSGEVAWLVPERPNIHRVENGGDATAISIHVYGTDIARAGNSIRREYREAVG